MGDKEREDEDEVLHVSGAMRKIAGTLVQPRVVDHGLPRGPIEVYEGQFLVRRPRRYVLVQQLESHHRVDLAPRQRLGHLRGSSPFLRAPGTVQ